MCADIKILVVAVRMQKAVMQGMGIRLEKITNDKLIVQHGQSKFALVYMLPQDPRQGSRGLRGAHTGDELEFVPN